MKRRVLFAVFTVLFLVIVAVGSAIWFAGRSGSGALEGWIGAELQNIVNSRLKPKFSFRDLDYQYPLTVTLSEMRLTADDPVKAGDTVDILTCRSATLTLAEIPDRTRPIVIEKVVLNHPTILVKATGPRSDENIGFDDMLRDSAKGPTSAPGKQRKLSDVLQIRLVQFIDAAVILDQRIRNTEPMVLNHINTEVNVEPDQAGAYRIDTRIAREQLFDLHLAGLLNLDDLTLRGINADLQAEIAEGKLNYLPARLQRIIQRNAIRGTMIMHMSGDLPLRTPSEGEIQSTVDLRDANVAIGDYHIPIKRLEMAADLSNRRLNIPRMRAAALSGTAELTGSAILNEALDGHLKLLISQVLLQEFLAGKDQDGSQKYTGTIDANIEAAGPFRVALAKTSAPATRPSSMLARLQATPLPRRWGTGTVRIEDGKLVQLPVISTIAGAVASASKIVTFNRTSGVSHDRLKLDFDLMEDSAKINDLEYLGNLIGAIGGGDLQLDGDLDLTVHGGPIERIRGTLGKTVGRALGAATGQIVSYRVTGTVDDPRVSLAVGGKAGETVRDFFQGIGKGIQGLFGK